MKTLKYFLFLFLISLVVVSCDERDYDMPPISVPKYDGAPANITIKELKERFNQIPAVLIEEDLILEVRVIGNDVSGNIFKQLVVQDQEGEGYGIIISHDFTGAYALNPVGQKLFINLNGLAIGKYGGEHQIGYANNGSVGRMTEAQFKAHVFRDGLPVVIEPKVVKIDDLTVNSDSYVNTLIRIDNVEFVNGGKVEFAPAGGGSSNQDVVDADGKTMTVRTSEYAEFAKKTIPAGSGSIVGVLGRFNGGWQFTLRAEYDLINFGGKGSKADPLTVAEAIEKGDDNSTWWVKGYIMGSVGIGVSESNPITGANGFILTAPFLKNTVVIAEKADETDWRKYMVIQLPVGTSIESINLENTPANKGKELLVAGTLKKVFGTYGLATDGTSKNYELEGSGGPVEEIFKADLTSTLDPFAAYSVSGAEVWAMDPYGYAKITGYSGGSNNANEDWLITPSIDLTNYSEANVSFEHVSRYGNNLNDFTVWVSSDYTSGDPTSATWVQLPILKYSSGTSWTDWTNTGALDIPSTHTSRANVRIALKYLSTTAAAGTWEVKNFVVKSEKGDQPPAPVEALFFETFGTGNYPSGNRPKIAAFTDFDMKSPIAYSDASGRADIRTSGTAAVWFPATGDSYLTITGINTTGYSNLKLEYDVAANVYDSGATTDLNSLKVTFNGQALTVPSKVVSAPGDANKFYTLSVDLSSIPTGNNVTLEFMAPVPGNAYGLRLDNIKITGDK